MAVEAAEVEAVVGGSQVLPLVGFGRMPLRHSLPEPAASASGLRHRTGTRYAASLRYAVIRVLNTNRAQVRSWLTSSEWSHVDDKTSISEFEMFDDPLSTEVTTDLRRPTSCVVLQAASRRIVSLGHCMPRRAGSVDAAS